MKHTFFIILMFVAAGLSAKSLQVVVKVHNPGKGPQQGPVVVQLSEIKGLDFDVESAMVHAGNIVGGNPDDEDRFFVSQLDDLDGDGRMDELVFVQTLPAGATEEYTLEFFSDKTGAYDTNMVSTVYADMMLEDKKSKYPLITSLEAPGDSYLYNDLYHHGAAFENAQVGFRIYFDQRQNIDIYGKKLYRLELADTHFYTTPEQMKADYGNDVLWAGNSIGCGSFKGWDGKAPTNIEPVKIRGQRIVASGPVRTIVEVKDLGWNGHNMRQYYTLYGYGRLCEVRVEFDRPLADEVFVTGVQKVGENPTGFVKKNGVAASWGSDYPEMGKKEQFPPETVGLAVIVPEEYVKDTQVSDLNYLCLLHAQGKTSLKYYVTFCADKEEKGYHDAESWFKAVEQMRESVSNKPELEVTIVEGK